jgi:hypothetical protein
VYEIPQDFRVAVGGLGYLLVALESQSQHNVQAFQSGGLSGTGVAEPGVMTGIEPGAATEDLVRVPGSGPKQETMEPGQWSTSTWVWKKQGKRNEAPAGTRTTTAPRCRSSTLLHAAR